MADEDDVDEVGDAQKGNPQQADPVGHDRKDEWDLAIRFRDIQRFGYLQPKEKKEMSEKAIQAVIDRARESLGSIQKPYRNEFLSLSEIQAQGREHESAELEIEESLIRNMGTHFAKSSGRSGVAAPKESDAPPSNSHSVATSSPGSSIKSSAKLPAHSSLDQLPLAKGRSHFSANVEFDPVFQVRTEKLHGLVLVLDTSLSMKGEKLALLGVAVAAVVMSLPAQSVAVLGFDSEIHTIKNFDETLTISECVERLLSIPPGGFTNIELGLNTAREWGNASGHPQARIVLVSDGRYTEGKDPAEVARGFPFVYALKIGKDPTGREVMRDIADSGMGRFLEVREMRELPHLLLKGIRSWVR